MTLTNLFRLHAVLAALYAIGLVLFPKSIIALLSSEPLGDVGAEMTRLFGAALVMVTLLAWSASRMTDHSSRRVIASVLFVYVSLGAVISLIGQLAGIWGPLGWSNLGSYLIFVLGYGYFLYRKIG